MRYSKHRIIVTKRLDGKYNVSETWGDDVRSNKLLFGPFNTVREANAAARLASSNLRLPFYNSKSKRKKALSAHARAIAREQSEKWGTDGTKSSIR